VALVRGTSRGDAEIIGARTHNEPNQHAERLLGLVEEALKEAGVDKRAIDRIAVGVGPGSFTGVRVGLSIAQGLMLGLGVAGVGVGSLRALAAGLPASDRRLRVVVRDARREEYFVAAYDADGRETVAPHTIPQAGAEGVLGQRFSAEDYVILGTELSGLPCAETELTAEPDARGVATLALGLLPEEAPVTPHYVRGPNVVRPKLPPSPLEKPRT
jgi:tRNA threonylcarbamoyladenosine biosynthesis protein TsaB